MSRGVQPRTDPPSARRPRVLGAAGLVLLVAGLYATTARRDFVDFDTFQYLTGNPRVTSGLSWSNFTWAWTTFAAANWHPLTWLSHQLDVECFGLSRAAHHLANAAWHATNAVLLYLLLARWTNAPGRSLFVAAVWAVHPLQVESVAWIVERKELLSTCFGLAALHAWTSWARTRAKPAYALALAAHACALMSKPTLVTLPFALLLFDAWPFDRLRIGWRARILEKLPFVALAGLSCWITVEAQRAGGAVQGFDTVPFGARVENAVVAYATYLRRLFWPDDLAVFYPLRVEGYGAVPLRVSAAVVLLLGASAWLLRRRSPAFAVGACFFLGTLVPVIGLVQVGGQALADRYAYVPSIGVLVILAWGIRWPAALASIGRVVGLALVVAASVATWRQIGHWRDTRALAEHALLVTDDNYRAHALLGHRLVADGELDLGLAHLFAAIRLAPGDHETQDDLGVALARKGRFTEAEVNLRAAVAGDPDRVRFLDHLAQFCIDTGKLDEALGLAERSIALEPARVGPHYLRGVALLRLGRKDEARAALTRAAELAPTSAPVLVELARLELDLGDLERAARRLDATLALDPRHPQALQQRARLATARGLTSSAILDLRAALAARPGWTTAQVDLAWLLATAEDPALRAPEEAVTLAEAALAAGNETSPAHLDLVALAYASDRRFLEAVAAGQRALDLARSGGDAALAARIERRLEGYRRGVVDRETPR